MSTETASDRVRQALQAGTAPARRDIERALRDVLGLSARQARRFAAEGCKSLVAGGDVSDANEEILERLRALESSMRA